MTMLSEKVKAYLKQEKMTSKEFCYRLNGVSETHFSRWLNDKVQISKGLESAIEMIISVSPSTKEVKEDPMTVELLKYWNALNPSEKYEILSFVAKIIEKKQKNN